MGRLATAGRCHLGACLVAAGLCLVGAAGPAAAAPQSVLILSEGPVLPCGLQLIENIVVALRRDSPEPLNIYEESIDRIRLDSEEYDRQLVALYKAKYVALAAPTLIITITEPALDFALRHHEELFPQASILFGAVDERIVRARDLITNATGVFHQYDVRATVEAALSLHPRTRQVVVVGGASRLDRGYLDVTSEALNGLASRAAITYLRDQPLHEVLAAVAALGDDAIVLFVSMQTDGDGVARTGLDVLAALRRVAAVPIYGMSGNFVGRGIVGGMTFDVASHGADLAQRARHILSGVRAADLVPMRSQNQLTFDWRELERFGVDEARLPPGATVVNRELGLWDVNKPTILLTGAVMVGQFVLIGGLLIQRRRRRRAEIALRDRQDALGQSQRRYALATAAGAVGVWDWNVETNEIYVDPTLKSILGFEDAEITNRADDWGARIHRDDIAPATAQVQACLDGRASEYDVEHRMIHKDGSVRWFLSRGSLLRHPDGTPHRMVGTKVDVTERKRAEEAIRESEAILQVRNREIQNLAGRLIASQENERARLARELHDDLSQQIAGLSLACSAVKRRADALPGIGNLSREISALQERMMGLAENIRNLSHNLHPSALEHAGLVSALATHCAELRHRDGVTVTFSAEGDFESTTADTALCLFRVAQEGLRNVVTHAGARHAEVRLIRTGDCADLIIADDGNGFDIVQTSKGIKGLGLVSINERVRLVGGTVSIVTEVNKGTRLHVQVPANGPAPVPA